MKVTKQIKLVVWYVLFWFYVVERNDNIVTVLFPGPKLFLLF